MLTDKLILPQMYRLPMIYSTDLKKLKKESPSEGVSIPLRERNKNNNKRQRDGSS